MITDIPYDFGWIITVCLGLMFGSFVTMASYRIPAKLDLVSRRSACPLCHHTLGVIDLIPLFSWISTAGTCRYCHRSISKRYPLIELVTVAYFMLVYGLMYAQAASYISTLLAWIGGTYGIIAIIIALERKRFSLLLCLLFAGFIIMSTLT